MSQPDYEFDPVTGFHTQTNGHQRTIVADRLKSLPWLPGAEQRRRYDHYDYGVVPDVSILEYSTRFLAMFPPTATRHTFGIELYFRIGANSYSVWDGLDWSEFELDSPFLDPFLFGATHFDAEYDPVGSVFIDDGQEIVRLPLSGVNSTFFGDAHIGFPHRLASAPLESIADFSSPDSIPNPVGGSPRFATPPNLKRFVHCHQASKSPYYSLFFGSGIMLTFIAHPSMSTLLCLCRYTEQVYDISHGYHSLGDISKSADRLLPVGAFPARDYNPHFYTAIAGIPFKIGTPGGAPQDIEFTMRPKLDPSISIGWKEDYTIIYLTFSKPGVYIVPLPGGNGFLRYCTFSVEQKLTMRSIVFDPLIEYHGASIRRYAKIMRSLPDELQYHLDCVTSCRNNLVKPPKYAYYRLPACILRHRVFTTASGYLCRNGGRIYFEVQYGIPNYFVPVYDGLYPFICITAAERSAMGAERINFNPLILPVSNLNNENGVGDGVMPARKYFGAKRSNAHYRASFYSVSHYGGDVRHYAYPVDVNPALRMGIPENVLLSRGVDTSVVFKSFVVTGTTVRIAEYMIAPHQVIPNAIQFETIGLSHEGDHVLPEPLEENDVFPIEEDVATDEDD